MKNICEWDKCSKTAIYKAPAEKDNISTGLFSISQLINNSQLIEM